MIQPARPALSLRRLPPGFVRRGDPSAYEAVPPVYLGTVQILHWGNTSAQGMTAKVNLPDEHGDRHPFRGMPWGASGGQRLHLAFMPFSEDGDSTPRADTAFFSGEAQLLFWGEDCSKGKFVSLRIDAGPDGAKGVHPFEGMSAGLRGGERLFMACWAIADDETAVDPSTIRPRRPFSTLKACAQANIMCLKSDFQRWVTDNAAALLPAGHPLPSPGTSPGSVAAGIVKAHCGIESRSELDEETPHGEASRTRWRALLASFDRETRGREPRGREPRGDS
jgi:hypothetical protein